MKLLKLQSGPIWRLDFIINSLSLSLVMQLSYLMGGPQVSLMVWVVTPSPRRLRGTSSGFTFTATLWLSRPRESSRVRAATATEYWKYHSQLMAP